MLTLKCPYCGSYNDEKSDICYFCKKELPGPDGKPRKHKASKEDQKPDFIPVAGPPPKRVNRPGCLMMYILLLFLAAAGLILLVVNGAARFYPLDFQALFALYLGVYGRDFAASLAEAQPPEFFQLVMPIFLAALALIVGLGLFLLQRWARTLTMFLQFSISLVFIYLFYILITKYYNPMLIQTDFVIVFFLILIGIIANLFMLFWFFEHSPVFPKHERPPQEFK